MIDRSESADSADVLLVEPSDDRARLAKDRLTDGRSTTRVHVVPDGDAALAFLEQRDEYADAPTPCLAVLRAGLPASGSDALGLLEALTETRELARIPTIVTVGDPDDDVVAAAYQRGANAVVPTPDGSEAFRETMASIRQFWIATARLPNRNDRL